MIALHSFATIGIVLLLAGTATAAEPTTSPQAHPLGNLKWISTGPLINPVSDPAHKVVSVKDPSIVRHNDRWHIYATIALESGAWHMVYLNFADWAQAAAAKPYYLDANPNLRGYRCAPQVFYFTPHKKWYLIFQAQQPQYCTADEIDKPETWTKPQDFFKGIPASVEQGWIDYWIICDKTHAYLFFTDDHGRFYRSRTRIEDFPRGMSDPVVIMHEPEKRDLFEGGATYKLKGQEKYLTIIECANPRWERYYKAFIADKLDGEWRPIAGSWDHPFAGQKNVRFEGEPWTIDISHGELLREGFDETMTIDPDNLQLLYQGRDPASHGLEYHKLPYRLGLLRLDRP